MVRFGGYELVSRAVSDEVSHVSESRPLSRARSSRFLAVTVPYLARGNGPGRSHDATRVSRFANRPER